MFYPNNPGLTQNTVKLGYKRGFGVISTLEIKFCSYKRLSLISEGGYVVNHLVLENLALINDVLCTVLLYPLLLYPSFTVVGYHPGSKDFHSYIHLPNQNFLSDKSMSLKVQL